MHKFCKLYRPTCFQLFGQRFYSAKGPVIPPVHFKYKGLTNQKIGTNSEKTLDPNAHEEIAHDEIIQEQTNSIKIKGSSELLNSSLDIDRYEIIYGIHPVLSALQSKRRNFRKLYCRGDILKKNHKVNQIYKLGLTHGVPISIVHKKKLQSLAGDENINQGVCLEASTLSLIAIDETKMDSVLMNKETLKVERRLWLYLDQINDPMNFGAILRTAFYLGVEKVITSQKDRCPITSVVSKASSGVAEIFPVYSINNVVRFLSTLKEYHWVVIASSTSNRSINLDEYKAKGNILLIVGNEGKGISRALEEMSDVFLTVPSRRHCSNVESLNVSVATSLLIYNLLANSDTQ